jgi:hypothetical protein
MRPLARAAASGTVIQLKERSLVMLTNDLILRNPLRLLGATGEDILQPGALGAVLARHGVGKTALIIQIALNSLLQNKNVLHISLNEPVGKVDIWYNEMFERMAQQYRIQQMDQLRDATMPHRLIMTFRVEGFSVPRLVERLTDLTTQQIFEPHMVIIDGLPFDTDLRGELQELKQLASREGLPIWLTVTTHRHEAPAADGLPPQLSPVQDLFDLAVTLKPEKETIHIVALKGGAAPNGEATLTLDPSTMLIQSKE